MNLDEIKEVIADTLGVDEDKVTPDANLIDDLGADSLAIVELHMEIEEKLGIKIPDEVISELHTVSDVLEAINKNK
ncbi:acyl carrier protein [Butyrivibrio sp. WCD3002]|jgi:acyl carrier protein|uniref:acyl carrier protein n=1 Tax=Butyrivibrio sp. WCD3002 TaxID=1280676 RepID=UPI000422E9D8|nr:acyl carrier protein [Butyrivibrio sp. WCD3002]